MSKRENIEAEGSVNFDLAKRARFFTRYDEVAKCAELLVCGVA